MAANGHSHPPMLSHTGPRNTRSDGTSNHIWHHPATLRNRLTVKQVYEDCGPMFPDLPARYLRREPSGEPLSADITLRRAYSSVRFLRSSSYRATVSHIGRRPDLVRIEGSGVQIPQLHRVLAGQIARSQSGLIISRASGSHVALAWSLVPGFRSCVAG